MDDREVLEYTEEGFEKALQALDFISEDKRLDALILTLEEMLC